MFSVESFISFSLAIWRVEGIITESVFRSVTLKRDHRIYEAKNIMEEKLPTHFKQFVEKYPDVWDAHQKLTLACAEAGPLDRKTRELIKVAISGTAHQETALQRHTIMAVKEGASEIEVYQAILLMITTVGFPRAAAALKWAQAALKKKP